jgi:hypothetical protein
VSKPKKAEFHCPVCRRSYKQGRNIEEWVENLPNNHLIVNLIDERKMEKKEECDYCRRQEKSQPASSWCPECCDRLCEICVEFHSVNRLTMEHKVCNLEDQSPTKTTSSQLFCPQHASRKLEVYCFDHEEPCCLMCATVSHRKCEKVSSLDECAQNSEHEVPQLLEKFEQLAAKCDMEISRVKSDKQNLCKDSRDVETRVKSVTEEIARALKERERKILAKLDESEKEHGLVLHKSLEGFLDVQKKLGGNIEMLRNSDRFSKLVLFLEVKKMGKEISNTQSILNNLVKAYKTPTLEVNINERVKDIHVSLKTFGDIKINLKSNTIDYHSGKLVLEKSLNVSGGQYLTDVEVIDGSHLVTACQGCNLYLLDASGNHQTSIKLSGRPWGITAFQDNQVCVALNNSVDIFKVDTVNLSIKILKEVTMTINPQGISAVDEKFTVALTVSSGQVFRIYDKDGNFCEEHKVTKGDINTSGIHAISSLSLLYTSFQSHSLLAATLNNSGATTTRKLHEGNGMRNPIGVTCDPERNIYVACYSSRNVFQFDPSGKFIRKIIDQHPDVLGSYGIRVKYFDDDVKLLLTCQGKILIFRFS